MMLIDHCTASCGYAAAFVSCLSFGSFALPMKGRAAKEVDVHPLVFQTYKTLMCFLTSFSVLFLGVDKLTFSPWGIVSGLFWIPAGITYVCGIRTAGLAICHGTAASIIVMVSFSWGIFVFHERVRSLASALFAVFLMICGIFGMSFSSAPREKTGADAPVFAKAETKEAANAIFCFHRGCWGDKVLTWTEARRGPGSLESNDDKICNMSDDETDDGSRHSFADEEQPSAAAAIPAYEMAPRKSNKRRRVDADEACSSNSALPLPVRDDIAPIAEKQHVLRLTPPRRPPRRTRSHDPSSMPAPPQSAPVLLCAAGASPPAVQPRNVSRLDTGEDMTKPNGSSNTHLGTSNVESNDDDEAHPSGKEKGFKLNPVAGTIAGSGGAEAIVSGLARHAKVHYGIDISTRQMGLLIAAFGAIWGGSVMVPLHYAGESAQGLGFVFSFAMGATLVNAIVWIAWFLDALRRHGCDCGAAINSLPPLHLSKMMVPGGISGVLWSIGNMASMISVTYLGEGVGYSMTQSAMLVSGIWGIFLFKEITDPAAIRGWLASACLAIGGILLLSYNHLPPSAPTLLKKN